MPFLSFSFFFLFFVSIKKGHLPPKLRHKQRFSGFAVEKHELQRVRKKLRATLWHAGAMVKTQRNELAERKSRSGGRLIELQVRAADQWAGLLRDVSTCNRNQLELEMISVSVVPPPLLPCWDPFEDFCFSIKCSPGHLSSLLLPPFICIFVVSPSFLLCLSACLSEIGGRLWSPFKIVGSSPPPRGCSGYRWVASGCQSARPIKTDSSCRCLKTVADRVTQQFTGVSGKNWACPYGQWVESGTALTPITFKPFIYLFLICKCGRNDASVACLFKGLSTLALATWFRRLSCFPLEPNEKFILQTSKGYKDANINSWGKVARNFLAA